MILLCLNQLEVVISLLKILENQCILQKWIIEKKNEININYYNKYKMRALYINIIVPIALHIIIIVEGFLVLRGGRRFFNSSNLDFW